jgi:hypothetical protein
MKDIIAVTREVCRDGTMSRAGLREVKKNTTFQNKE